MALKDYYPLAADNEAPPPQGAPQGATNAGSVDDILRTLMASMRTAFNDIQYLEVLDGTPEGVAAYVSATSFKLTGEPCTAIYHVDREVRITQGANTIYGDITASETVGAETTVTFAPRAGSPTFTNTAFTVAVGTGNLSRTMLDKLKAVDLVTNWADIPDKPATFAPSAHTHDYASITGKPATFPPDAHTQDWSTITGKPATFTPSAHSHDWTTGITGKPSRFAPSSLLPTGGLYENNTYGGTSNFQLNDNHINRVNFLSGNVGMTVQPPPGGTVGDRVIIRCNGNSLNLVASAGYFTNLQGGQTGYFEKTADGSWAAY